MRLPREAKIVKFHPSGSRVALSVFVRPREIRTLSWKLYFDFQTSLVSPSRAWPIDPFRPVAPVAGRGWRRCDARGRRLNMPRGGVPWPLVGVLDGSY